MQFYDIHLAFSFHSAAIKTGVSVEKKDPYAASNYSKIDAAVEAGSFELPTVGVEFKLALLKARQAKGLSQKDLAEKINIKSALITEYEQGKSVPTPAIISKLNRTLGVQLPKLPKQKAVKLDTAL